MRRLTGPLALGTLGALSAILYAAGLPVVHGLGLDALTGHVLVFAVLFALYLAALWVVTRPTRAGRAALVMVLGFGLLFRVLMLPTPVYLSSDLYRYLWDGRVQLAGINPYRYPPAAAELSDLRDPAVHPHINRPASRTVYPPGAQWLFALAATVTQSVTGWRALLLSVEVVTGALLLRLLRRLAVPPPMLAVYAWSPLVVFEGVQAGHVDLLTIPLVLLALGWRQDGHAARAGAALGLAGLVKLYPLILVATWWRRGDAKFPAAAGVTVALGYLPYAALLGTGALGFLPEYFGSAEDHNIGLRALLTWGLGFTGETARAVVMTLLFALLAAVLVWIGRRHRDDAAGVWRAGALAVGAYLLLAPTSMHPWYVLWIVPFLCAVPAAPWLYFSGAVTLSYVKYVVDPAPLPWWAWVGQYGPLYALLLVGARRALAGRAPDAVALRTT